MNNTRQKVIDQINIVDEISSTIELNAKGRNYVGLCPFHADNNPSFTVSEEKKIYKCFVCGEGGDVVKFHSKYNHISQSASIEQLASKYNISIPKTNVNFKIDNAGQLLNDINKFYVTALHSTQQGLEALNYLKKRGFDNETIKYFHLGYSYDINNGLYKYIEKKITSDGKYSYDDVVSINQFQNERDLFSKRITIPIIANNQIIGYGGRAVDNNSIKYLNSKDSKKFSKKETLFHFDEAIKLSPDKSIVVVEGFFDAIKAYQFNIKNAVALMGTAFSNNHLKQLRSANIQTIYLGLDGDAAGQQATLKVGEKFVKNKFKVKVLNFGKYKDLDEFLCENGYDEFHKLQVNGLSFKQFQASYLIDNVNLQSSDEKDNVLNQITENLDLENDFVIEEIVNKLENTFKISRDFIKNKIEQNRIADTFASNEVKQDLGYENSYSPEQYDDYYYNQNELEQFEVQSYAPYEQYEQSTEKEIIIDSSVMFMDKTQLVIFRALSGKSRYNSLNMLKIKFNKDLGLYNNIFNDLGVFYEKFSKFDFVTFTDLYPKYSNVITDLYNKKITNVDITDEELIKALVTKSSWGLFNK